MAIAATTLRRAMLVTVTVLVAAAAVTIAPASAGPASAVAASCPSTPEHPFLRWLDPAAYTLAPGGDFEARTTRWQLSGGTKVVDGNEPFMVHDPKDTRSLSVPAGGSALSPEFCVGLGEPTLRLFVSGGSAWSLLKVEVLYRTVLGTTSQTVALVPASRAWQPTLQIPVLGNVLGLASLDGFTTSVRLRFTALGTAGWRLDDVYVDPWKVT